MRQVFVEELCRIAEIDERIWLLTADLGYGILDPFIKRFPDRYVNVGVAEQNMIGVATGLAESGLIPFCWSITPFALLRPLEFIKNGPVLHESKVRIVGTGIGKEYETAGPTHWCPSVPMIIQSIGGMWYYQPHCADSLKSMMQNSIDDDFPMFIHLARSL